VRLLEAWDSGWRATLDGAPTPLIPAYDVFMAVPVPAGSHEITLAFVTPGAATGLAISVASLALVAGLWWLARRDAAPA
jgi:uncharacterized membrane protein YfhO